MMSMERYLVLAIFALAVTACAAPPDRPVRNTNPSAYITPGARALASIPTAPQASTPGVTESTRRAGQSDFGPGQGVPESYYGIAPEAPSPAKSAEPTPTVSPAPPATP